MRMPFAEQAVVPEGKLVDYLLNETHREGRGKAAFFMRLGFQPEQPNVLRQALLHLALISDMTEVPSTWGTKYVGQGMMGTPSGRQVELVTVWMLQDANPPPILVTAYPVG